MSNCFNLTESRNCCYRSAFSKSGLRPTTTDLRDGTAVHCWVPKSRRHNNPNLLLLHGFGANALWQFGDLLRRFTPHFNVYVPDLVFFGGSSTTRPDRSEAFQARCVMRAVDAYSGLPASVVGLSYGGFVGYSLAAQFGEAAVERVVVCCAGVAMEERDLGEGMFRVADLEEAARILVPESPARLRELVGYTFSRPPPLGLVPDCLLSDFIGAMCSEYVQEKRELILALPKGRKLSDLPKITQPTLIIWGEEDQVFPLELAHRLKRHLGENAQLAVIKKAGHAFNYEKPKEFIKHLKSFLLQPLQPPLSSLNPKSP